MYNGFKHKCKDEPDLMYKDRLCEGGDQGYGWCSALRKHALAIGIFSAIRNMKIFTRNKMIVLIFLLKPNIVCTR